ncbi:MAG TPA: hypothetical protein VG127_05400, partial [Rubrobacteraceae bacterium]|nr:hypothetical protein [Rubrobacteraceae bacterium]
AIGLKQLWQRGEFGLEDPVNDYLRGYEVEVLGEDGKLHEVAVSASDGRVLGQETEEDEGSENDDDSENEGPEDGE